MLFAPIFSTSRPAADDIIPGMDQAFLQFQAAIGHPPTAAPVCLMCNRPIAGCWASELLLTGGVCVQADPYTATARALYNMGVSYKTGQGTPQNLAKAAEVWRIMIIPMMESLPGGGEDE
jgi:TPR repeat protein